MSLKNEPKGNQVPQAVQPVYSTVVALLDEFCKKNLTDEYAQLCREMAAALSRKRPSPLLKGRPNIWAAAIVYALGSNNFLDDKSQTPHMRLGDIGPALGASSGATAAKAKVIRESFQLGPFDSRWSLPSRLADSPLAWMIQVNGFVVDARQAPYELQVEAHRLGLIPFVPASAE